MLDTIFLQFNWTHTPFGTSQDFNSETGAKVSNRQWVKVASEFSWAQIQLRSWSNGIVIKVKGSPSMFLQGHNVFGSNDALSVTFQCVSRAMTKLGIPFEADDLRNALRNARVTRIDFACSLKLPFEIQTKDVVRALQKALLDSNGSVANYKMETALMFSRAAPSRCFYDKKALMAKKLLQKWQKHNFIGREYLAKKLEGLLRFEIRLKAAWLKHRNLHILGNWNPTIARGILRHELEFAFSKASVLVKPIPGIASQMTDTDRQILAVWLMGWDVGENRGRSSFANDKKRFNVEYGIDLTSHPDGMTEMPQDTAHILKNAVQWLGYPRGARERGLVALRDNSRS